MSLRDIDPRTRRRRKRYDSDADMTLQMRTGFYVDKLTELAVNRFKWHGLPPEIDERYLELTLFGRGLAIFFQAPEYGKYFALTGSPSGPVNFYQNPTTFTTYGVGINSRRLAYAQSNDKKECVPIWANKLRIAPTEVVDMYATRLAHIDVTIDQLVIRARNPRIFAGDKNMVLSAVNAQRQITAGVDFLALSADLTEGLQSLDNFIDPRMFSELHTLRARVYNEAMGFLGVDNANQEKRERLIEGEVEANEEQVDLSLSTALSTRQAACEEINRKYGLAVSVDYIGKDSTIDQLGGDIEGVA